MNKRETRPPTDYEVECTKRLLLLADEPGYLDQLVGLQVKPIDLGDNYGSVELISAYGAGTHDHCFAVAVAFSTDADGIPVSAILHVHRDGRLEELEFVREDGKPMIVPPAASSFSLDVPWGEL